MLTVGGLFDGCGLLAYGLCLAGLEHRWLCEVDPFRRELLGRRWPEVRIYDDVRAVGADAERVDVIAGGFPCKGASTAGKREGFGHPETRLWREMARAVGELRPRFVVIENVANLLAVHDGAVWGEVLGDLAALGYDCEWDCIPAAAFGAPHLRDRLLAVAADTDREGEVGLADVEGQSAGWPHLGRGDLPFVADSAESRGQAGRRGQREGRGKPGARRRDHALAGASAPAAANRDGMRQQPEPEPGSGGAAIAGGSGAAPAYADGELGRNGRCWERQRDIERRGIAVEWGDYWPAIRRWEAIRGPAPEPLVRRVDDRRANRVDRSRLSALGDGVQVQLGEMVGRFLMEALS